MNVLQNNSRTRTIWSYISLHPDVADSSRWCSFLKATTKGNAKRLKDLANSSCDTLQSLGIDLRSNSGRNSLGQFF